jgi:hypothetical protein
MPLHSRSSMRNAPQSRFRNARSGLFERYCDPSSASPVTVGAATNRRLGCQAVWWPHRAVGATQTDLS